MTTTERMMPALGADERTTLESWLDFYRATLVGKCDGLTDEQVRAVSVPPSPLSLLGLVRHLAEVERNWFRRVLAGEQATPVCDPEVDPDAPDAGFDLSADAALDGAVSTWQDEIAQARENRAGRGLDQTSPFRGGAVNSRWIYTHMIGEYARHCGHADLIRERIDGATGV